MKESAVLSPQKRKRLNFWAIISLVCLLFTFLLWDHYLNSGDALDQTLVSYLILISGSLFSAAAGFFSWWLESGRDRLEVEVEKRTNELMKRSEELKNAFQEIRELRGFIPICSMCKKVRNDKGFWQKIEEYIHQHSELKVSHGLCQDCSKKLYDEFQQSKHKKKSSESPDE